MKNPQSKSFLSSLYRSVLVLIGLAALTFGMLPARAQIDPDPRQILHLGVNESIRGQEPMGAYAFYYWNMANVPTTNVFLRLAIAPCYVDSEMGFKGLLGKNTDLAVGAFGGLYADSYQEVDGGNYKKDESFNGNGGGGSVSIYHLFNPTQMIPLSGVLRASVNGVSFDKNGDTATMWNGSYGSPRPQQPFALPANQAIATYRAGLRWGGKEPYLMPTLGMEISGWYELEQRTDSGSYGFDNDRRFEQTVQRLFGRAQLNYTTLESKHYIVVALQGGGTFNSDRYGCFRLGGVLPYTCEFPLPIPGYGYQEISAVDYGLLNLAYTIPFGPDKTWSLLGAGAIGVVKYEDGTGQSGSMNSGVGAGIGYTAPTRRWKLMSLLGYGFEAKRGNERGGATLGAAFQYNFGSTEYASQKAYEELQEAHGVTR